MDRSRAWAQPTTEATSRFENLWTIVVLLGGLALVPLYSYQVFHTMVEVITMVVALALFIIAWNSRHLLDSDYLLYIGISFLFFALLDIVHTLAYQGIQLFRGFDANLPTQVFMFQRLVLAASFIIAPRYLTHRLPRAVTMIGFAALTALGLASIMWWRVFPDMFVEGEGLTPLKTYAEYVVIVMLLVSVAALRVHRRRFDATVLRLLGGGILTLAVSEFFFTLYSRPTGLRNYIGHLFQILAFYLIYSAIVRTALVRPYAVLYRQLYESEERYRDVAETLQSELLRLPEEMPGIELAHAYRSASDIARIGGDFYDIFRLNGNKVGLVLGDVSGKGLSAAGVTAEVRSAVHALAHVDPDPSFVLTRVNEVMYGYFGEDQFVTAVYACMNLASGEMLIGAAGHPDPVLCGRGRCDLQETLHDPPLGVFEGTGYGHVSVTMRPGDSLVIYSDGITEARRGKELFGEERVHQTLAAVGEPEPEALLRALVSAALDFAGGSLSDDTAVLCVRYIGAGVSAPGRDGRREPLQV